MSEPIDALAFLADRLREDRHYHHRHCVHNLSAEEQKASWRRRTPDPDEYDLIYGDAEPIVITPDEWEIDAPDLDWSRIEGDKAND